MTPVLTVRKTLGSRELMRRKLMTSSLLPDLEHMISGPSLVRKLSLLGLRYLEEHAARMKKKTLRLPLKKHAHVAPAQR